MSRPGRGLVVNVLKNFWKSIQPRQYTGDHVGTDYLGNQYFEITKSGQRPSRYYKTKGGDHSKFDEQLPAEWEAWLRLRRKVPPTEEEINRNLSLMVEKKRKAAEIDVKFGKDVKEKSTVTGLKGYPHYEEFELHPGHKPKKQ